MSWKIGMPNLGHTMEEGKVSEWLKRVGDPVAKGEVIAVVESDKASFDVEAPADGTLLAIDAKDGAVVPVGATIGVIGTPGELRDEGSAAAPPVAHAAPGAAGPVAAPGAAGPVAALGATGPVAADTPPAAPALARSGRLKISPAARALAEELGVDPAGITASSDDGMINRDDVRAFAATQAAAAASPLSPMRRAIAAATGRAWQTIPHVALHSHADVDSLLASGAGITASIARATALALREHPAFNGWLVDERFEASRQVNLALAISTPDGLLAAVVPQAENRSVAELGQEIAALAEAARGGGLEGARTLGGSFTISSLGRWGVDAFAPIIVAPQVAILGVGRIQRVAREGDAGAVRFASALALTLEFDHRANDGVQAARLLAAIVAQLENPQLMEVAS